MYHKYTMDILPSNVLGVIAQFSEEPKIYYVPNEFFIQKLNGAILYNLLLEIIKNICSGMIYNSDEIVCIVYSIYKFYNIHLKKYDYSWRNILYNINKEMFNTESNQLTNILNRLNISDRLTELNLLNIPCNIKNRKMITYSKDSFMYILQNAIVINYTDPYTFLYFSERSNHIKHSILIEAYLNRINEIDFASTFNDNNIIWFYKLIINTILKDNIVLNKYTNLYSIHFNGLWINLTTRNEFIFIQKLIIDYSNKKLLTYNLNDNKKLLEYLKVYSTIMTKANITLINRSLSNLLREGNILVKGFNEFYVNSNLVHFSNGYYNIETKRFNKHIKTNYINEYLDYDYIELCNIPEHIIKDVKNRLKIIQNHPDEYRMMLSFLYRCLNGRGDNVYKLNILHNNNNDLSIDIKLFNICFNIYSECIDDSGVNGHKLTYIINIYNDTVRVINFKSGFKDVKYKNFTNGINENRKTVSVTVNNKFNSWKEIKKFDKQDKYKGYIQDYTYDPSIENTILYEFINDIRYKNALFHIIMEHKELYITKEATYKYNHLMGNKLHIINMIEENYIIDKPCVIKDRTDVVTKLDIVYKVGESLWGETLKILKSQGANYECTKVYNYQKGVFTNVYKK